ncbi:hypothetical protein [Parachlamydia sp. AcF125]|uniref:hypothetical protein n=1 Tax=Parachlamydia sp. AcF125 TaxID=2795736 RepID=UPI001BC9D3C6|nr:hypothetical protein [Parachlamydia sp. AcF125]MBS4167681.1 hypothetical protein [Parachlamydia sp. AcF125]
MTPTFSEFFKSFYYSNTYVPPVDLSKQGVSKHLLETENPEAAATAQRLISNPEVQQVLSEPLTYDLTERVPRRNAMLERHEFKLLSTKSTLQGQPLPFYSVLEHEDLPGWIIKSGATRVPKGQFTMGPFNDRNEMAFFTDEESLLRIKMANRIAKVAQEANIQVVLPKKKLVAYANSDGVTEPTRKYCVVCEKIDILSAEDTFLTIRGMDAVHQKEIARKISIIVQKAGFVDASFDNIRLTPDGKIAFIDTEPVGLMVAKKSGLWHKLFGPKGASVEKCARIGLWGLMRQSAERGPDGTSLGSAKAGLEEFHKQVKSDYEKAVVPKLSKWKITVSIFSLGLIPLVNAVVALVKTQLTKRVFKKLQLMDAKLKEKVQNYLKKKVPEESSFLNLNCVFTKKQQEISPKIQEAMQTLQNEDFVKDHQKRHETIAKQFFAYIEGTPYKETEAC